MENLCLGTVQKQITDLEKIFANHISDKELVSRIYKNLLSSTI